MVYKLKAIGAWFGRVLSAAAPFIPDPKAKLAAGAAAAVLTAATEEKEADNDKQDQVQGGV